MAAPKRTKTEREEALAEVARLDRRGWSQRDIAAKLGVTHQQVAYDLKLVRSQYAETQLAERAAMIAEKREQYRDLRKEAWEAWERSKEDKEKVAEETISTPKRSDAEGQQGNTEGELEAERLKVMKITEGRLPENQYLRTILDCLDRESDLDSLNPPKKMEHSGPAGGPIPMNHEHKHNLDPNAYRDFLADANAAGLEGVGDLPPDGEEQPLDQERGDGSS